MHVLPRGLPLARGTKSAEHKEPSIRRGYHPAGHLKHLTRTAIRKSELDFNTRGRNSTLRCSRSMAESARVLAMAREIRDIGSSVNSTGMDEARRRGSNLVGALRGLHVEPGQIISPIALIAELHLLTGYSWRIGPIRRRHCPVIRKGE